MAPSSIAAQGFAARNGCCRGLHTNAVIPALPMAAVELQAEFIGCGLVIVLHAHHGKGSSDSLISARQSMSQSIKIAQP